MLRLFAHDVIVKECRIIIALCANDAISRSNSDKHWSGVIFCR